MHRLCTMTILCALCAACDTNHELLGEWNDDAGGRRDARPSDAGAAGNDSIRDTGTRGDSHGDSGDAAPCSDGDCTIDAASRGNGTNDASTPGAANDASTPGAANDASTPGAANDALTRDVTVGDAGIAPIGDGSLSLAGDADARDSGVGDEIDGDASDGGTPDVATMFIADEANGVVYRYNVTPSTPPVLTATIPASNARAMALGPTGEFFVAQRTAEGDILRFQRPQTSAIHTGTIVGLGTHFVESLATVDDQLWAANTADEACTTDPQDIVWLAFSATGTASSSVTVTPGLLGADRGMVWDSKTRSLYVSQCEPVNTILHIRVPTDHSMSVLSIITDDLQDPRGMALAPWGELFVAETGNAYATSTGGIVRYSLDEEGNATNNGTFWTVGSSYLAPIELAFAPWGELFIVSQGTATVERDTFRDPHNSAFVHDTFEVGAGMAQSPKLGSIVFMPGGSTTTADGG